MKISKQLLSIVFTVAIVVVIAFISLVLSPKESGWKIPQERNLPSKISETKIDVTTHHYDVARTGANTKETLLTPLNITPETFGKLFSIPVDGQVYAQPLYKANVALPSNETKDLIFIATAHDSLYAADAHTGKIIWKDMFVDAAMGTTPVPDLDTKTTDITPEIGIIGTPVIDPNTSTLYVVSKNKKNTSAGALYEQYIHAIDLATGKEKFSGPKLIQTTNTAFSGKGLPPVIFDPLIQNQRSALLLSNGRVYIAWASHGTNGDYHGFLMSYNASDLTKPPAVFVTTETGVRGGIWMASGGPSTDGKFIYLTVGNGSFSPEPILGNYGDTVLKLLGGQRAISVADSFTPFNQAIFDKQDMDMGTTNTLLIPSKEGSVPLLAVGNKSGDIYIIDRSTMGGYDPAKDHIVQRFTLKGSLLNNISFFNGMLYIAGNKLPLQAFSLSGDQFNSVPTSQTSTIFGETGFSGLGANPIISANGTQNAIVWALDNSGFKTKDPAILYAYDAYDLSHEFYNSTMNPSRDRAAGAVKFSGAVVANGMVYVQGNGAVTVYGLLPKE